MKKNWKIKLIVISVILITVYSISFAKERKNPPIIIESNIDNADITIGDNVKYSLIITYDTTIKTENPPVGSNLGEFEIKDYKIFDQEKTHDGKIIQKFEYIITTFTTGDYIISPVSVKYKEKGKNVKEIQSGKIFIRVHKTSSKQGDKEDVRALKEVVSLKVSKIYYLVAGLIFLVLIGAIAGYFYFRKKDVEKEITEIAPYIPPHELALKRMQELWSKDLLSNNNSKEFFIVLSEIIREYISGRYNVMALDRTTEEIVVELKSVKVKWDQVKIYKEILDFSDMVKFAKLIPEKQESEKVFKATEEIINLTNN